MSDTVEKLKVHRLKVEAGNGEKWFGISSHENDYRLSWALNNSLHLKLAKANDLNVRRQKSGVFQRFSMFEFRDEENAVVYKLIANRSEKGFLLQKMKNIDFIFYIAYDYPLPLLNSLLSGIKQTNIVQIAFELQSKRIQELKKLGL